MSDPVTKEDLKKARMMLSNTTRSQINTAFCYDDKLIDERSEKIALAALNYMNSGAWYAGWLDYNKKIEQARSHHLVKLFDLSN